LNMRRNDIEKFARKERGVETIEVAVVLPLMLLVMFAGFEYGWALLKSIQVDHAARVGAREASLSDSTAAGVDARIVASLQDAGLTGATITYVPADPAVVAAGTRVEITVEIPYSTNRLLGLSKIMPLPATLRGRASAVKEPDP